MFFSLENKEKTCSGEKASILKKKDLKEENKWWCATTHWKSNIMPFVTPQTELQIDIVCNIYGKKSETF